jgi:hypothetical protein
MRIKDALRAVHAIQPAQSAKPPLEAFSHAIAIVRITFYSRSSSHI